MADSSAEARRSQFLSNSVEEEYSRTSPPNDENIEEEEINEEVDPGQAFPEYFQGLSNNLLPLPTEPATLQACAAVEDTREHPNDAFDLSQNKLLNSSLSSESSQLLPKSGSVRTRRHPHRVRRLLTYRIFLLLTEPTSSISSAAFFLVLMALIILSNILMIMESMDRFQYIPVMCEECVTFTDSSSENSKNGLPPFCRCAPVSQDGLVYISYFLTRFFTVEWSLRVLCFSPSPSQSFTRLEFAKEWFSFLLLPSTVVDALAIFPSYFEFYRFHSFRLFRLFRVFRLARLGTYNNTFTTIVGVMQKSINSLNTLLVFLSFGGAIFGSMLYFTEKGDWKYNPEYNEWMFMRAGVDGYSEEPSPFRSIPHAFWWFIVTVTTVGYGDYYPTTTVGKIIGTFAMLSGVLVLAIPISVFSDLWSKEVKEAGLITNDDDDSTAKKHPRAKKMKKGLRSSVLDDVRSILSDQNFLSSQHSRGNWSNSLMPGEGEPESMQNKAPFEQEKCNGTAVEKTSLPRESNGVILSTADINVLKLHLASIDESQLKIREILGLR